MWLKTSPGELHNMDWFDHIHIVGVGSHEDGVDIVLGHRYANGAPSSTVNTGNQVQIARCATAEEANAVIDRIAKALASGVSVLDLTTPVDNR